MKIRGKIYTVFTNDGLRLTEVTLRFKDLREIDIDALYELLGKRNVVDVEIVESQGMTLA